ncbi:LysR family transcriptional regulator [Butyrivibrio sp. MC2013]|uniref:LysR family transcriptional regulator n=1 Tax=Butyrivibrio sp. MC2013 TaxID=1280686 RepID=UPI00047BE87C|nr:LysR family transcriptional regulator [Butyrivibrio sp. MC2013]
MNLLELRYFRTAAKLENFSKTAEHHLIPQSAVSITIKKLEQELGCSLFDRSGKSIRLNDNGRRFLETVDHALSILDEGINALREPQVKGIGINIQSGIHFMTYLVPDFEKQNPGIRIFFLQGYSANQKEADFTFFQLPIDDDKYEHVFLMDDEIMAAVPKKHPLASKKILDLSLLTSEHFIAYDPGNRLRIFTDSLCREAGFEPVIAFETGDMKSLRSMIEAGLGISLVPSASWRQSLSGHARLIPLKSHPMRTLVLAYPKGKVLSPEEELFLDYTCKWFHNLTGKDGEQ